MNKIDAPHLIVPLGNEAHSWAQQFATKQTKLQKRQRVYLNSLSVFAVHSYLKWLQIESELCQSDSWDLGMQTLFDVADLFLPSIGRLECRPILPGETIIYLPPEATENRIGYIAVQLNEVLNQAQLVGFHKAIDAFIEEIPLVDFQPLETLFECIQAQIVSKELNFTTSYMEVNLSRWQKNLFEKDWLSIPTLLNTEAAYSTSSVRSSGIIRESSKYNSLSSISRAKIIELRVRMCSHSIALIVTITSTVDKEMDILVQVRPTGKQIVLPKNLRLIVQDAIVTNSMEVRAREEDNWIQIEFSGQIGERFSVKLFLENTSITEYFLI